MSNYSNLKVRKLQPENFHLEGPVSPPGANMYSAGLVLGARAASKFDFKPLVTARLLVTVDAGGKFQHCAALLGVHDAFLEGLVAAARKLLYYGREFQLHARQLGVVR